MAESEVRVVELFAKEAETFACDFCGKSRRYYDLLSDGRKSCLECSDHHGFDVDPSAGRHSRDPVELASDPELVIIRNSLVARELQGGAVDIGNIWVPPDLAEELADVAESEGTSLSVLVVGALRLLFSARKQKPVGETTPVLPEKAVEVP